MSNGNDESETKGSVLVVDDNLSNLNLLSKLLNDNGYEVRPAISGALALLSLSLSPTDLILLDVKMPEMDGFEVCRRVKANEKTRDIPVIFVSAMGEVPDKVNAFRAGGVDYIMKPYEFDEVLARVGTHITMRKMQKSLIRTERMAALGRLSQAVAHEVRNPATVIGGFARRLQKQLSREEPAQGIIDVILAEAERLERIVADVDRYCNLRRPVRQPANLCAIVETVLLSYSDPIERHGIIVRRSGFEDSREEILCDEELLEYALNNIFLSAVEAMRQGGTLELTITPLTNAMLLSIRDTGSSIPAEIIQNVFEPFFACNTRGSGFGLALAHRIISEQSGEISLFSSPGCGTDVQIKMPLAGLENCLGE